MGIQTIGIQKAFGGVRDLAGVNLALERKEIVGPIGPNGPRTATALNVTSGIFSSESGSVTLDIPGTTGMSPSKVARHTSAGTGSWVSARLKSG